MFVVLLKKTDYNTRVAAIDTKISSLDDKITENKNNLKDTTIDTVLLSEGGDPKFDGEMVFKPI